MKFIWVLKLKLDNELRESIEEFIISHNATITSLDSENKSNILQPKSYDTSAFFIKKPSNIFIKKLLLDFKIKPKTIILKKIKIKDIYKNNITPLNPITIGRFTFLESKNLTNFNIYKNVIIPPGLGFGTGHHASTKGILYLLNKIYFKKNIKNNNLIDIGCGSGILGITMAKLWKKKVELIDIDKQAINTSVSNAKLNFLDSFINVKIENGLNKTNKLNYDIIVINILAKPILTNIKSISKKLDKNGRVIISGLIQDQKFMILNKLRLMGLILEMEYKIENWVSLLIKKN
ncbi:MAG: 50S ribosomal protein L11 methyltransferase [Alphaproteobacteria bacterium]|nr:50S ribosomal protein L11 methyltransferase [Alphaproteobacteria bacterium]